MMDVEPAFVADGEPPEFVEPCKAALDDPSMLAKFLAGIYVASGNARLYLAAQTSAAAAAVIIGFVGVQLVRSAPRSATLAADMRNGIGKVLEWHAVVNVGSGEINASGMPRRSVIRWRLVPGLPRSVGFGPVAAPLFLERWINCPCRPGSSRCNLSLAAGAAVRDAKAPNRQPFASRATAASISHPSRTPSPTGACSHGMPVRRTNRMPVSAARAGTGGAPPFRLAETDGSRGSIINQSDSDRTGEGIPPNESAQTRVQRF